jgi:uncharacterized RDD family membrane protein YckC
LLAAAEDPVLDASDPPLESWLTGDRPASDDVGLQPGERFGPYRIERLLGRGGMGAVYAAEHLGHGRRVALKVLSQRFARPEDRARFLREGQLAASVNHPHSVYIFGCEEIAGVPAIVMELLPGGTLKDRVQAEGPLAPRAAVDVILQVIAGLDAAHVAGVLHRDIKPSNCLVGSDGTIKIGDFGLSISTLARHASSLSTAVGVQGTPQFAAPEQLRGDPLDVRADIYAVGATLYYLLTGAPPFDHRNLTALLTRIATEPPAAPDTRRHEIPAALSRLVVRCLAKNRDDRPASYAVLTEALRPFSSEVSTPASLGSRLAAAAFDLSIVAGVMLLAALAGLVSAWDARGWTLYHWAVLLAPFAYWTISEASSGTTYGKWACGLRLVPIGGHRLGTARAFARGLLFALPAMLVMAARPALWAELHPVWIPSAALVAWAALVHFSGARLANGWSAWHDQLTGTHVVVRANPPEPLIGGLLVAAPALDSEDTRRVGPYDVIGLVGPTDVGDVLLGFDPRLKRVVWIHLTHQASSATPVSVRAMTRSGRLRWLAGQATPRSSWDAYEATDGRPLVDALADRQPWSTVGRWLLDLASELAAGQQDGSVRTISRDRLWITGTGRVKLLDFRAPGLSASSSSISVSLTETQRCLSSLAEEALGTPSIPSALAIAHFRRALHDARFATLEELVQALERVVTVPDRVTARQRGMSLALMLIGMLVTILAVQRAATPWIPAAFVRYVGAFAWLAATLGAAAVFRGGFWLRVFGMAVVTADGQEVSPFQALQRAFAAWGWLLLQLAAAWTGSFFLTICIGGARVAGLAWTADHPAQGPHDRLLKTYVVPR